MHDAIRISFTVTMFGAAFLGLPHHAAGQTPTAVSSQPSLASRWLPELAVGIGTASVGTEGPDWTNPIVASVRVGLSRFLVVESEWTSPVRSHDTFDSGDIGLSQLNGELGIYGRNTRDTRRTLRTRAVNVFGRARAGRFSFLGGAGLGWFNSDHRSVETRTGCTGPWVVACEHENGQWEFKETGRALLWVGGIDVAVLPRVSAFVSGRIGGSNGLEEGALVAGVRTVLVPERSQRGVRSDGPTGAISKSLGVRPGDEVWISDEGGRQEHGILLASSASAVTVRTSSGLVTTPLSSIRKIEVADSIRNGLIWGAAAGTAAGLAIASYDEPRTLPVSLLAGSAVGALIDALSRNRRIVYEDHSTVSFTPMAGPGTVGAALHVAWR